MNQDSFCVLCLALHDNISHFSGPKMFILISTVMTWACSKSVDPVSGHVDGVTRYVFVQHRSLFFLITHYNVHRAPKV